MTFHSMLVHLTAALVRSALVTITSWPQCYDLLRDAALEHIPYMWVQSLYWPAHCDSPAIAATLSDAARGLPSHTVLGRILPDIVKDVRATLDASRPADDHQPPPRVRVQKILTQKLQEALYADSVHELITRRLHILCPSLRPEVMDFDDLRAFMRTSSPAWSTAILKTWANAWTTSVRLHLDPRRSCLFGCAGADDDLSHYVTCPRMWDMLFAAELPRPPEALRDGRAAGMAPSVPLRMLLMFPLHVRAVCLVTAFLAYNAIRHFPPHAFQDDPTLLREVCAARAHALSTASGTSTSCLRRSS